MVTNTLSAFSETPILQEIHHGTIRAHHAKKGYDYPTIQLPFSFSRLIGLSTHIYQTVHNGAMAFLVVVSPTSENSPDKHENAPSSAMHSAFKRRRSKIRITSSPRFFFPIGGWNRVG